MVKAYVFQHAGGVYRLLPLIDGFAAVVGNEIVCEAHDAPSALEKLRASSPSRAALPADLSAWTAVALTRRKE